LRIIICKLQQQLYRASSSAAAVGGHRSCTAATAAL